MTVTSNIQGVLDRAIRRSRDVHTALERTLSVAIWDKLMREEAKRTLWALAKLFGIRPYYDHWDSRT